MNELPTTNARRDRIEQLMLVSEATTKQTPADKKVKGSLMSSAKMADLLDDAFMKDIEVESMLAILADPKKCANLHRQLKQLR